jgi:hypothetical protein
MSKDVKWRSWGAEKKTEEGELQRNRPAPVLNASLVLIRKAVATHETDF